MRIAIVDDDAREANELSRCISENLSADTHIDIFSGGEQFLSDWELNVYDLIILDIYMADMMGTELAQRIRERDPEVCLVFCTTSNEFASESYEVEARYYLLKPFMEETVKKMLNRLHLHALSEALSVILPGGKRVLLKNILYTECSGHNIFLKLKDGSTLRVRMTQKRMEELLCFYPEFVSCFKGIIVNMKEAVSMNEKVFHMSDERLLPISRRKVQEIKTEYARFCFQQMRSEG